MNTKRCAVCNRNLLQWSNGWPEWECSHISCPQRPHAWSDFSNHGCEQFEELPEPEPTIERLFDQP